MVVAQVALSRVTATLVAFPMWLYLLQIPPTRGLRLGRAPETAAQDAEAGRQTAYGAAYFATNLDHRSLPGFNNLGQRNRTDVRNVLQCIHHKRTARMVMTDVLYSSSRDCSFACHEGVAFLPLQSCLKIGLVCTHVFRFFELLSHA